MSEAAITRQEFDCQLQRLRDIIDERDRRYKEATKSAKEALEVSMKALTEYKAQQNEWRGALADMGGRKLDRTDYELRHKEIEKMIGELRESRSGFLGTIVAISTVVGIIAAGIVSFLVAHFTQK